MKKQKEARQSASRLSSRAESIKEGMKKRRTEGGEGGTEVDEGGGDDPEFLYVGMVSPVCECLCPFGVYFNR